MVADVIDGPWVDKPAPETVTEAWCAKCFEDEYAGRLAYCIDSGRWLIWDGATWTVKPRPQVEFLVHTLSVNLSAADPPPKNRIKMQSNAYMRAVENLAQKYPTFTRCGADWDNDPWLLGTPDGTVDLKTGTLRKGDSDDMITKRCAVSPADRSITRWLQFLDEATGGDQDVVDYLQTLCGYALTGDTREQQLWFIYGPGGSGKGVFLNTLQGILNEYSVTPPSTVIEKQKFEGHSTDIAMMRGARLVAISETDRGSAWNEQRIKQLTGGDNVTARLMRADNSTWTPQLTLFIIGNHAPALRSVDLSIRRRLVVVPFRSKPAVVDQMLGQKLRAEWPGILRWMIEGCLIWQKNGFTKPAVVFDETEKYFSDQDVFAEWVSVSCDVDHKNDHWFDKSVDLYLNWRAFAEKAGVSAGSSKTFRPELEQLGFRAKRATDGVYFYGIQLRRDGTYNGGGSYD